MLFLKSLPILLAFFQITVLLTHSVALAQEDEADDIIEDTVEGEEDGDATVEVDEDSAADTASDTAVETDDKEQEEEEEVSLKPSPDAATTIIFTQPAQSTEFPAGKLVKCLVGFVNNGDQHFIVETMDASFRYPQDFSIYLQNFTVAKFERLVESKQQITLEYAFQTSETFNARPFGLTVSLNYRDAEGKIFQDAVFNDTITIVELDDGLDGETFFLYVFLAALSVLTLVGVQQLLASLSKKKSKSKPVIEMGTQNNSDIDYDWLPEGTVEGFNKTPGNSPKSRQSPGRRRTNRGAAED